MLTPAGHLILEEGRKILNSSILLKERAQRIATGWEPLDCESPWHRAELSHQLTRVRERGMRKLKSINQAQRFLNSHAAVYNLFKLGRHLISADHYQYFRHRTFASWEKAAAM